MKTTILHERLASALGAVRAKSPLVHNITNYVAMNNSANALLAIGASPVMAHWTDEMEEMTAIAGALVINIGTLDKEWIEGMFAAGRNHAQLSQRLQKLTASILPNDCLHLTCGGCHLCESCTKAEGKPCRMPEKALPSLEGYCVDVYNTTKDTPLKYINGQNTVTYFGMILF